MRKTSVLVLLILAFFIPTKSQAQDDLNRWAVGFGGNIVDVSPNGIGNVGDQFRDYFGTSDWNTIPGSKLYLARYLGKGFIVDASTTYNKIKKTPLSSNKDNLFYNLDLGVRYDLNHAFGETAWFDPYVKLAIGGAWVEKDMSGVFTGALGFNTWFTERIGLNFESAYKSSSLFGDNNLGSSVSIGSYHFQHSISFVIRFDDI